MSWEELDISDESMAELNNLEAGAKDDDSTPVSAYLHMLYGLSVLSLTSTIHNHMAVMYTFLFLYYNQYRALVCMFILIKCLLIFFSQSTFTCIPDTAREHTGFERY